MAEALASTLASCVVTELIRELIACLKSVKRCKSECRKLEKELKVIEPDVEKIERRLKSLQGACNGRHYDDLQMVEDWLERLKDAIQQANVAVQQCNSGNRLFSCKLSERITLAYENITKAADNRMGYFLQLNNLYIPEETSSVPCYESPGEGNQLRLTQERNESLRPEDLTRLSRMSSTVADMAPQYSPRNSSYHSPGSSSFYEEESNVYMYKCRNTYESSDSPRLQLMSHQRDVWMTQERNESLHREGLTRLSMSSSSSHSGRYGSPIFSHDSSYHSPELSSSSHGEKSSVHESSESAHSRLMSQQRNEILQREDRTRSPLGHSHQMERLYSFLSSIVPQLQHYVPANNSSGMPYYAPWNTS